MESTTKETYSNTSKTLKEKFGGFISKSSKYEKFIDKAKYYVKHPDELNHVITEAYNKATNETGNRSIGEMWMKIQALFRMVKSALKNEYNDIPKAKVILGVAVILYFISPVDILPDFLPFLGFADDVSLFAWFLKNAAEELNKYQQWESTRLQLTA